MEKKAKKSKKNQKASVKQEIPSIDHTLLNLDLIPQTCTKKVLEITSKFEEINRPINKIVQMDYLSYENFKIASNHSNPDEEKCTICMYEFNEQDSNKIVKLNKCEGHFFHLECIEMCHKGAHLRCPICGYIYGIMTGDMPPGTMYVMKHSPDTIEIEGCPNTPVLEIIYQMKAGTRDNIQYPGTKRHAFLPCTKEGEEILRLLLISFERRLTFTIGTSVTTGRPNQIIWNGIHHKTSVGGGPACFGYPDDTYFCRVKEELAAKGIY